MRFPRLHYNKTAVALCKNHIYFCNVANSSIAKYPCSFCVCSPYAYAKYVAVFAKTPCKTLDVGIITYLLKMASAQQYMPKELVKPKRTLAIYTTPSVSSTDGKTYIQLVKKGASKKAAAPVAASPVGSQIRIEPVQTFLQQEEYDDDALPASHNAVLSDMTPYMRQKLKARRMRGGGFQAGMMERLTIGFYFGAWYALNIVYNSKS